MTQNLVSIEDNKEYVDAMSSYNPVEDINSEIDRELLLKRLSFDECRIVELLEAGYEIPEIADKMGVHRELIRRKYRRIKVLLGG